MARFEVYPGAVIGRLEVKGEVERNKHSHRVWKCECSCPAKTVCFVAQPNLKSGSTMSCGCLRNEATVTRNTKHGHAVVGHVSREYSIWLTMKDRCLNPESRNFHNYGGRGIRVCDEWQDSFEAFLRDMGPRPSPGHSVERHQNDGHYEPGNCSWSTRGEQMANRRCNVYVDYKGERLHISEAARRAEFPYRTALNRKNVGYPDEELFLPVDHSRPTRTPKTGRPPEVTVLYKGERLPLKDAAAKSGVGYGTLKSRHRKGLRGKALFAPVDTRKSHRKAA